MVCIQFLERKKVGQVALHYATSSTLAAATQSQDPPREALRVHKRDLSFLHFLREQDL